jgi:hypothetical protein
MVNMPECEADHSPSPAADIKNAQSHISTSSPVYLDGVVHN